MICRIDTSTGRSITPRPEHYRACTFAPNFNPGRSFREFMATRPSLNCYGQMLFPDVNRQPPTITVLAGAFGKLRSTLPFVDFVKQYLHSADIELIH